VLLEKPGELVTRETLIARLWPPDTFVDFDQGLKKAVNRLREALSDCAEQPRFIETLPRRGYRFVAEVHEERPEASAREEVTLLRPIAVPESEAQPVTTPDTRKVTTHPWIAAALLSLLLLSAATIIVVRFTRPAPLPTVFETRALTNDGLPKQSLATDDVRLYFAERVGGTFGLSQMSVHGGESLRKETPFVDPNIFDISPDQTELLVSGAGHEAGRDLWVVPVPAGAPHRVGDVVVSGGACWAPDGVHILYTQGHDLYFVKHDGTEIRKIATVAGFTGRPRYSPTGDRVRFTVYGRDGLSLWEMRADGKDPHRLSPAGGDSLQQCCGMWSPDGEFYYFLANFRETPLANPVVGGDLWVTRGNRSTAETDGAARLTIGPLAYSALAPSRDGGKLYAVGTQARAELTRYDPRSNTFEPFLVGISALDADISRDGQWIAYVTFPEFAIWVSKLDGSNRRQLTFPPAHGFLPRWSPDGKQIVYTDLDRNKVFIVPRDSGVPTPLLPDDPGNQIDPTWMPDRNSIVFARTHLDPDLAIYQVDLKTRQVRMVPGSKDLTGPRVSPDGRWINALSRDWTTVMIYDVQTEKWQQIAKADKGVFAYTNWSHDGEWIYARKFPHRAVRINLADHHIEPVVDLKDFPEPGPSWMALAPDDSIFLHRDRSVQEIYALTLQSSK